MTQYNLLPCPFCGTEVEIKQSAMPVSNRDYYTITCEGCGTSRSDFYINIIERSWNSRVNPQPQSLLSDEEIDAIYFKQLNQHVREGDFPTIRTFAKAIESKVRQQDEEVRRDAYSLCGLVEELIDYIDVPDKNCTCCISPPCNDCVEFGGLREVIAACKRSIAKQKGE
jgi:hypothetical protein